MTDDRGLARTTDPDTAHEAAAKRKSRARLIAQDTLRWAYPEPLTARGLTEFAMALFPDEVKDEPGFLSSETIRRRWREFTDARFSPDGRRWGEVVMQTHPDGSLVVDREGRPVPERFTNPLGNSGRGIRWLPR